MTINPLVKQNLNLPFAFETNNVQLNIPSISLLERNTLPNLT